MAARPAAPAAGLQAAAALHEAGRLDEAETAYRALRSAPPAERRMALRLLGLLQRQRGRTAEALGTCDQLLALGDRSAELFGLRGDLLQALDRRAEAVQAYDRALQLDPQQPEVLNNRGAALEGLGRPAEALEAYAAALRLRPDYVEALFNRGVALATLGRREAALESYDQALAIRPAHAEAHNNRALLLAEAGRAEAAVEAYDRALALRPDYAQAWNNRSVALRALGQPDAALDSAEQALALRPDYPEALNTRGLALAALLRFEAALDSFDQALAIRPGYAEALSNAGLALTALGRPEAGLQRFDAALAQSPGFAEARFNRALALLRLGRFEEGWRAHEARWGRPGQPGPTFPDATLWLGEGEIAGLTLLAHAEQGLGDTLQFCRFVPALARRGARVVLQVQPPLASLLQDLPGAAQVIPVGAPTPAFDRHIPLMSLPLALGITVETLANATLANETLANEALAAAPYLRADPRRAEAWAARLAAGAGPLVGLAWSGNPAHENDRNRSLPLAALAAALAHGPPARFVSLQKGVRAADRDALVAWPQLRRVEDELGDFPDTAALVQACDLVISVDTSVAHLAGALGRPVWILLPRAADWRWMTPSAGDGGARTPWYPSARLLRQAVFGDWSDVLGEVARRLGRGPPFA